MHRLGDLAVGKPVDSGEEHRDAILGRQLVERARNRVLQVVPETTSNSTITGRREYFLSLFRKIFVITFINHAFRLVPSSNLSKNLKARNSPSCTRSSASLSLPVILNATAYIAFICGNAFSANRFFFSSAVLRVTFPYPGQRCSLCQTSSRSDYIP
jgi:hypothetical protein